MRRTTLYTSVMPLGSLPTASWAPNSPANVQKLATKVGRMGDSFQTTLSGPLVSIILPVRDGESAIGDTLESSLSQGSRRIGVIVDDGSPYGIRRKDSCGAVAQV